VNYIITTKIVTIILGNLVAVYMEDLDVGYRARVGDVLFNDAKYVGQVVKKATFGDVLFRDANTVGELFWAEGQ